jgi:hypothetical protein
MENNIKQRELLPSAPLCAESKTIARDSFLFEKAPRLLMNSLFRLARMLKKILLSQNRFHALLLLHGCCCLVRKQRADGFDNNTGTLKSFPIASLSRSAREQAVYIGKHKLACSLF